ncbi:MAG: hypothetical protein FD123_135 [Bacteroidetes bacterium]|nr:MAG: hypothetical protein FD123_135 [Bacteroidota bacterium]
MQLNKNIAISDSGFIFNPSTGDSFSTNPVGLEIIRLLRENKKKDAIIKELTGRFSIDDSTAEKDLSDFLLVLRNYQLLNDHE